MKSTSMKYAACACGLALSLCAAAVLPQMGINASRYDTRPYLEPASAALEEGRYLVPVSLWKAAADEASMGAVAMQNNALALVLVEEAGVRVQFATNPVSVSGYESGIQAMQYDADGAGGYTAVSTLEAGTITTGTKFDGQSHTFTYLSLFEITLPDYVEKQGTGYIPVKIQVPYTPMDVVAVGEDGYLDARLKIMWSEAQETDAAVLTPDTRSASGTSSLTGEEIRDVHLKDSATGIALISTTETVSDKAVLRVTAITSGEEYTLAQQAIGETAFGLYRIALEQNGAAAETEGSVQIAFPVSRSAPEIYRINPSGTKTTLTGTGENGYYTVATSQLGLFAAVGGLDAATQPDYYGHWGQDSIENVLEKGLVDEIQGGNYGPDAVVTRRVFVTGLARLSAVQAGSADTGFYDVAASAADAAYIAWASENGIVNGKGDGRFAPDDSITREEMAEMLYRYMQLNAVDIAAQAAEAFADAAQISTWAQEAAEAVAKAGLMQGKGAGRFDPASTATRAEYAVILCNYIDRFMGGK